ncbi:MAG: hypothetical protein GY796_28470, partial [Chloroflexi bacterium]|nr:hypothetical protein [Chloroflexota bacterium]
MKQDKEQVTAVPRWARIVLLLIILAGFGVRIYALDGQSMWSDEGLSLYRARQSLPDLFQNVITVDGIDTQDTNPPFYFLLLHLWRRAAGEAVFTLRFVGVATGLFAIPLMFNLGRLTYDWRVGLAAALLTVVSPFHVWQVQVLRNYSLLLTLNLLAVYGLWQFVLRRHGRRWPWLILWLAATLLGIYTHYFGFFVFAYGVLVLGIYKLGDWRLEIRNSPISNLQSLISNHWRLWVGLLVMTMLLIPVVNIALSRFLAGRQVDFHDVPLAKFMANGLSAFSVGMSRSLTHPVWWVAPVVLLAILGIIIGWRRNRQRALILLGYQFVPLGMMLLLSLINPLYNGTRHLLIGLPPFLLLTAVGMTGLIPAPPQQSVWQKWATRFLLLWGLLVVAGQLSWLRAQFTSPELIRDDVRGLAEYLSDVTEADDLVVLHDTLIRFTFDFYYDGLAPVTAVPLYGQLEITQAEADLAEAAQHANRLWFVGQPTPRTGFPRTYLVDWAAEKWYSWQEQSFPSMWLRNSVNLYLPDIVVTDLTESAVPLEVAWEGGLQLQGIDFGSDTAVLSGSDWFPIFTWSRSQNNSDHYQLQLTVTDEQGQVWHQQDWPLWKPYPYDRWTDGEWVRRLYSFPLPAGLPPGTYQFWLNISNWGVDGFVPTNSGEHSFLLLSDLTILPNSTADTADLPEHNPKQANWPGVTLVGYGVEPGPYRPGHPLTLDVYWQAAGDAPNSQLIVQLLDGSNQLSAETITTLTRPDYPVSQWQAGELLHGRATLTTPAQAASGNYWLRLALADPETGEWRRVRQGVNSGDTAVTLPEEVIVETWPLETDLPPIEQPRQAQFGNPALVQLAGAEINQANASLNLTLIWQTEAVFPANYSVFLHLLGEDGEIVAQQDS